MTLEGVDYSYARPGGAALAKAGKRFAMRYIAHPSGTPNLTTTELRDLQSHGLGVGIVCERGKTRLLSGSAAGVSDGKLTKSIMSALGFPVVIPVYFAVDFDAGKAQQPAIDAYLNGAASILGPERVGVYGSVDVVERCAENSSARWFWQTYAWSGGLVSRKAHVLQYHNGQTINGAAVDFCRSLKDDFGVWMPLPDSSTETDLERTITLTEYPGTRTVEGTNVTLYLPDGTTQKVAALSTIANADAEIEQSDNRAPHGTGFVRLAAKPYAGWYGIAADLKLGPIPTPTTTPDPAQIEAARQAGYAQGYDVGAADTRSKAHIVPATISFD